jgi:hypothetical protein
MSIAFEQFDEQWIPVDNSRYSDTEKAILQEKIIHIFTKHQSLFGAAQSVFSNLFELTAVCQYYENQADEFLTSNVAHINSLALPLLISQGNIGFTIDNGLYYALSSGNMEIRDFRHYQHRPEITVYWAAKTGLERELDFRMMMTISMGHATDGFSTVSDLYKSLCQWDAVADILDPDDTIGQQKLFTHFSSYEDIWADGLHWLHVRTTQTPQVEFLIKPMWSKDNGFSSQTELSRFLQLPKPEFRARPISRTTDYLTVVPRGCGDYVVDYDAELNKWALVYSPNLGMYYRVTVKLMGTTLDNKSCLQSAYLILRHPEAYVLDDMMIAGSVGLSEKNHNSQSEPTCPGLDDEPTLESFC